MITDAETTSSAGSDQAPSEDNLQPEEIAEVVPINEDKDLALKVKKLQKIAEITKANKEGTGPNALRRR